jgi:histone H3/H4
MDDMNDPEIRRIEFENIVKEMAANFSIVMKAQSQMARLVRNYYMELMKSGFSEEQALKIVCKHGSQPPSNQCSD